MSKAFGNLLRVIDGDTALVEFTSICKGNPHPIRRVERVRLRRRFAPELGEPGSRRATNALRRHLEGRRLQGTFYARDKWGRLVGELEPARPFYGRAR